MRPDVPHLDVWPERIDYVSLLLLHASRFCERVLIWILQMHLTKVSNPNYCHTHAR